MYEWLAHRDVAQDIFLQREAPPAEMLCTTCKTAPANLRCLDCFGCPETCLSCCLAQHSLLPFHRIQQWNGLCFEHTSLYDQGFKIHLGHNGQPCPSLYCPDEDPDVFMATPKKSVKETFMVLVDVNGVFSHTVSPCRCEGSEDVWKQLFRLGLFPASFSRPQTAFTFSVLDYFHVDALECTTTALGFFSKLRRLTNEVFPHTVPVSSAYCCRSTQWTVLPRRTAIESFSVYPGSGET